MQPLLIDTKYFTLHSLWLFFAIAVVVFSYTLVKLSVQHGLKVKFLSDNIWKIIFWAIFGARIAYVIENYYIFFPNISIQSFIEILKIWDHGLSFWGAAVGILASFYYLARKQEQSFWKWLDVLVISGLAGMAIGDIGAFFDGANYGHETSLPWGVNFEQPAIKYTVPIHPTQTYAFLYSAALAYILYLLSHTKKIQEKTFDGFIGLLGISFYGIFRFLEEFTRGDDTLVVLGIRTPYILSAILAISAGVIFFLRYNNRKINRK